MTKMPPTKQQWIDYVYESNPAHPVEFARICAQAAIKAGELDVAVRWKEVIIAIQNDINTKAMRSLEDVGPDDDHSSVF